MQGEMTTGLGRIEVDEEVIATYAGSVAVECFGIVGMAAVNMMDGLTRILKKDYLNRGINVAIDEENGITLDFHVIVAYGVSIATVCENLRDTVRYRLEAFCGMPVREIRIHVEGVRVID